MKKLLFVLAILVAILALRLSDNPEAKIKPEFTGIDVNLKPYLDEWMSMAKDRGITFNHQVSIGFKDIDSNTIIGKCWYFYGTREIEIDQRYWTLATESTREALFFHELTHCFCGRGHDYGNGISYPDNSLDKFIDYAIRRVTGGPRPGYFPDGCPLSIMHPVVLSNVCYYNHGKHYLADMFDHCEAY